MMLEVYRLDHTWSAVLYEWLRQKSRADLIAARSKYLNFSSGAAIACVENHSTLKQVLFSTFNKKQTTTHIIGPYDLYTIDILDGLCATCSSIDPVIDEHVFVTDNKSDFNLYFMKSRLGRFASEIKETPLGFSVKINYPTA